MKKCVVRSSRTGTSWLSRSCLAFIVCGAAAVAEDTSFTQAPAVAESHVRGATPDAAELEADSLEPADATSGSSAEWIWGAAQARDGERFFFRKEFEVSGRLKSAALIATADNKLTVSLNGREILEGSDWKSPERTNLRRRIREGQNTLLVEAENAEGSAGFALQLVLTTRDGQISSIVTDTSWRAANTPDAENWAAVHTLGKMGVEPWGDVFGRAAALLPSAPRGVFQVLPGFQVELLYTVPKDTQGSWVCLALDDQGRILASDQGEAGLYRITPPPPGTDALTRVEKLDVDITAAQGLLHAFGSLYLSVNGGPGSGLYRARDTDGDDQYDEVTKLKEFAGGGEHGPHALRLSPDGHSLYVICGNHTNPPADLDASRIPSNWGEDLLLPRQWDARGHARGRLAPGGWIAKTDPDGQTWEIISIGYRNAYDMALNSEGELFAYDADMEWDMGSPWYRPTRLVHATSGSEFGWRSGTGKWPTWYLDSLPPVVNLGPGSPVGVEFGYGTKFPAKYQQALYLLDWTFGTIHAVHLKPHGSTYTAEVEEFLSRTPLPLTDAVVGRDGALYFAVGGRNTQSELYRVTYVGPEQSPEPVDYGDDGTQYLRALRRGLERYHQKDSADAAAIALVWEQLGREDRFIRYAARLALEQQPLELWAERALSETNARAAITALCGLARQADAALQPKLLDALGRIDFAALPEEHQLGLLRVYQLAFIRMGSPPPAEAARIATRLGDSFPARSDAVNRELSQVLVFLNSPTVISKTLKLMERESPPLTGDIVELLSRNPGYGEPIAQMLANHPDVEKVHLAFVLRNMRYGWTLDERRRYFAILAELREKSGGASYQGFIDNIRKEALDNMSPAERDALESEIAFQPPPPEELPKPAGPGRNWTVEDLARLAAQGLHERDFENGRRMYAAARCVVCHRFDGAGGATGPDLTNVAGRFGIHDLSEALLEPSKVVSDQYRASIIQTLAGKVVTGRIVSEESGKLTVMTDPEDASKIVEIDRTDVDELVPSQTSLMPQDLLNTLNEDEALDLLAYLMSRGNPEDSMFAER